MDLYALPTSLNIDGREWKITNNGDFRVILDCFDALTDEEMSKQERVVACLLIFFEELQTIDDCLAFGDDLPKVIDQMKLFFNCGHEDCTLAKTEGKYFDWNVDSQLICGAVTAVAKYDVRLPQYTHWWTFLGYFSNIREGTFLTVVSIRSKIVRGKKLEKYEREFKRDNPQYFVWNTKTDAQQELDEWVRSIWNSG